jgi:hypothetical protein
MIQNGSPPQKPANPEDMLWARPRMKTKNNAVPINPRVLF